jgi:hypothetical protein
MNSGFKILLNALDIKSYKNNTFVLNNLANDKRKRF